MIVQSRTVVPFARLDAALDDDLVPGRANKAEEVVLHVARREVRPVVQRQFSAIK